MEFKDLRPGSFFTDESGHIFYKCDLNGSNAIDILFGKGIVPCYTHSLCEVQEVKAVFRDLQTSERILEVPILTNDEKKYLEDVIRPFSESVAGIIRSEYHITILYNCYSYENYSLESIDIPIVNGTLFKGMDMDKEYKIRELGLFSNSKEKQI